MPPPGKKAKLCTRSSIDSVPVEILRMIFDRLRIKDLKNASLACHRWHDVIFSSARMYLRIALFWSTPAQVMKFKEIFSKSQRCYRKVTWCIADDRTMRSVWDIIHPKITRNLSSLEIQYNGNSIASMFALITDEIPSMTMLRTLVLIENQGDAFDQDIIPTLWSNSVKHLKVKSDFMFVVDMPELREFEGDFSALDTADKLLALPKLKHLTIDRCKQPISITTAKSIFRRLTNIEKMSWYIIGKDEILALCEFCTTLKELEFGQMISNAANITNLKKLINLRSLRVESIDFDPETQNTDSAFDWSKLTQIQQLQLGVDVDGALKLPKSIKKLDVCMLSGNEKNMIKTIIGCGAHLIELHVNISDDMYYKEPIGLLTALSHLKKLEVLMFYGGVFQHSSFLLVDAPLVHLQKLRFTDAELSSSADLVSEMPIPQLRFFGLEQKFPNLREPEFFNCCYVADSESENDESFDYDYDYDSSYSD